MVFGSHRGHSLVRGAAVNDTSYSHIHHPVSSPEYRRLRQEMNTVIDICREVIMPQLPGFSGNLHELLREAARQLHERDVRANNLRTRLDEATIKMKQTIVMLGGDE